MPSDTNPVKNPPLHSITRWLPRVIILATLALAGVVSAAPPAWWSQQQVTDVQHPSSIDDNYAPANLGQLKNFGKQAKTHLDAYLPGGAGSSINTLVSSFGTNLTPEARDANYAPINLGQLKAIAKPFYDRLLGFSYDTKENLIAHGYPSTWTSSYPWDASTPIQDNYAPANLGQLKMVFSFDLAAAEGQLPDWWQKYYFNGQTGIAPAADPDGDGIGNLSEYQQGSDPLNYYDQPGGLITPAVVILSGNNQSGPAAKSLPKRLTVKVLNAATGVPLNNAPVTFSPTRGTVSRGLVRTGASGRAAVTFTTPETPGVCAIGSFAGPSAVEFIATVASGTGAVPSAPSNFDSVLNADGSRSLSWTDTSDNEEAFAIWTRSASGQWVEIGTVPANTITAVITPEGTLAP